MKFNDINDILRNCSPPSAIFAIAEYLDKGLPVPEALRKQHDHTFGCAYCGYLLEGVKFARFHARQLERKQERKPEIGTAVLVVNPGTKRILVGTRRGSHAAGKRAFPGGRLGFGETWAVGGLRECEEECGPQFVLKIINDHFLITNDIMPEDDEHFVTIFMVAHVVSGEPINVEPNKNDGWEWLTLEELMTIGSDLMAGWIPLTTIIERRLELGL